jgi:hypothetical protein
MGKIILEPTCEYTTLYGNRIQLTGLSQKGLEVVARVVPSAVRQVELKDVIVKKVEKDASDTAKPTTAKRGRKPKGSAHG